MTSVLKRSFSHRTRRQGWKCRKAGLEVITIVQARYHGDLDYSANGECALRVLLK